MIITEFKILGALLSVNLRKSSYSEMKKALTEILERNYVDFIPVNFPVRIVVYHYLSESSCLKEDIDNKQKIIQDAMKGIIVEDDSLIYSIYSEKKITRAEEYFTVLIEEFNDTVNDNKGEIIGNIGGHKDREIKAMGLHISRKDKKINALNQEIEKIREEREMYRKELQDRNSEIKGLKKIMEEKDRSIASKSSAIEGHLKDKKLLKNQNEKINEELERLKWLFDSKGEKEHREEKAEKEMVITEGLLNRINKYTTVKANEYFLVEIIREFEKTKSISKNKIRNRISFEKVKKMIKEIFKVGLMNDGDSLIINNKDSYIEPAELDDELPVFAEMLSTS